MGGRSFQAFLFASLSVCVFAAPLEHWTWKSPTTPPGGFADITSNSNGFAALARASGGLDAPIFTCADGLSWTQAGRAESSSYSIASGNSNYVVLAGEPTRPSVYFSSDLVSWKRGASLTTGMSRVRFSNGLFIAFGEGIATSSDGSNWTQRLNPSQQTMMDIAYGAGKWVLVGGSSGSSNTSPRVTIVTSSDGQLWVVQTNAVGNPLFGVTYSGQFVAAGAERLSTTMGGVVVSSADGVVWTEISRILPSSVELRHVVGWNGVLIASSTAPAYQGVFSSIDAGRTWRLDDLLGGGSFGDSGPFATTPTVVASAGTSVISSIRRGSWQRVQKGAPAETRALAAGPQGAVLGSSTSLAFSTNLVDWKTTYQMPVRAQGVIYLNGVFAVVSGWDGSPLLTSQDGRSWTLADLGGEAVRELKPGKDGFLVKTELSIYTSPDGRNWTRYPSPGAGSIVYGHEIYLMNGVGGARISNDLKTWASITNVPAGQALYGNGNFYIFAADGSYRSNDGAVWEKWGATPSAVNGVKQISYQDGNFYWLDKATIYTSRDALSWNSFTPPARLEGFTFLEDRFLGYGQGGVVILSDPITLTELVLTNTDTGAFLTALSKASSIRFDCDGVVKLTNTLHIQHDISIEAINRTVSLDGGGLARLIHVGSNGVLRLNSMTLRGGGSRDASDPAHDGLGGAIFNENGTVVINDCSFQNNVAAGKEGGNAAGGDIYNAGGQVLVTNTVFQGSLALAPSALINPAGGSLATEGGTVVISGGSVTGCVAAEEKTAVADSRGFGGAIACLSGSLKLSGVTFANNKVSASNGEGGAVANFGALHIEKCRFESNGNGGITVEGAAIYNEGRLTMEESYFIGHLAIRPETTGGFQRGGAIYSSKFASISSCTFEQNLAKGTSGLGGAIYTSGDLNCTNCTFYRNQALGGTNSAGAAIYADAGVAQVSFCTFIENGELDPPGVFLFGRAFAAGPAAQGFIGSSILSSQAGGVSLAGNIADLGENLASDAPTVLVSATSITATDPKLGEYGLHGGTVPLFALLPDSPGINRGSPRDFPPYDQRGQQRPFGSRPDIGSYEALVWDAGPLVIPDAAALALAVSQGGEIMLDYTGTLTITNTLEITKDTFIYARQPHAILDGAGIARIFNLHTNTVLSLKGIQLQNARAAQVNPPDVETQPIPSRGSAILNQGGILRIEDCAFLNNASVSTNTRTPFGGLYSIGALGGDVASLGGQLWIQHCRFSNSVVHSSDFSIFPQPTAGGSIYSEKTDVHIYDALFTACRAIPGTELALGVTGGTNGFSAGGAICLRDGTMEIDGCVFRKNSTLTMGGAFADAGGDGLGGAIYNGGTLTIRDSEFGSNALPGIIIKGAAIYNGGALRATNCFFADHRIVRPAFKNTPGTQRGGSIYSEGLGFFSGCTFAWNEAIGAGPFSGFGTIPAQPAQGGAVYATTNVAFLNCTFFSNRAIGGSGMQDNVPSGSAYGGAVYQETGMATFDFCTFAANIALGGVSGQTNAPSFGSAIAIATDGKAALANSILAGAEEPGSASEFFGTFNDLGFNLSSESAPELNSPTTLRNALPKLGPFGYYGGYVPTLPLEIGSPAIDRAGGVNVPATDARGARRPEGAAGDIGAFERVENRLLLLPSQGGLTVAFTLSNTAPALVESSLDLKGWSAVTLTNAPRSSLFSGTVVPTNQSRYFRARSN